MPMGAAAVSAAGMPTLPPVFPPSKGVAAQATEPAPSAPPVLPPAMPPAAPAPQTGMPGMMPPPSAPAQPPYTVSLQPDGSSKYSIQTPGGEVVLGINPAPKLPKAFQVQQPPAQ